MNANATFEVFLKVAKRGDVPAIRQLLADGWNVNCRNEMGWTPLMWARGNSQIIRLLLDAGADVNAVNRWNVSPLAMAAQTGKVKASRLLLAAGAKVDVEPYGCSLLTFVLTGEGRNHPKIFQMLNEAGAITYHGNTNLATYPAGFGPLG